VNYKPRRIQDPTATPCWFADLANTSDGVNHANVFVRGRLIVFGVSELIFIDGSETTDLKEILTEKPVIFFVCTPFPRAVWIGEINLCVKRFRGRFV
jgi:hypothetical protein